MKYTVTSTALADHQLAKIWIEATDRQAVTEAYDRIEALLKNDAHLRGRLHPSGWRVLAEPPLIVSFRISQDDCLATVLSIDIRS
jgi:hypothetical protein